VDSGPPSSWRSALVKTGFFTLGLPAVLAGLSFIGLPVAQVGNSFYYFYFKYVYAVNIISSQGLYAYPRRTVPLRTLEKDEP
jgi:hypothetical protein